MPRTARAMEGGTVYHVLNRGNGRMGLVHKPADYDAFERVLMEGMERYPVELFRQTHCERDSWSGGADWRWTGLWRRSHRGKGMTLSVWPVERPSRWAEWANASLAKDVLKGLGECVQRGRPLGPAGWVEATAARLGLGVTLRNPGRPRKSSGN